MTILEQLREKKKLLDKQTDFIPSNNEFASVPIEYKNLCREYDLALENALLKLKNRGVQISDLKNQIKELYQKELYQCDICGKEATKFTCDGCYGVN